ncbi:MAG: beta strand repeat-containing protein, partial [Gemmataceae bacterium]
MASKRVDRFMKGLARILRNSSENKPVSLNLLALEEHLNPAPNLLVPSTSSTAPIAFVGGSLAFSGALQLDLLDTPTPASTSPFSVTVTASAGTVSATGAGAATVNGSGTGSLTLSGSLADLRSTLASLSYANGGTGAATLTVTARDSAATALTDSKSIFLLASSGSLAPTITSALAGVNYDAETNASPVARATIAVVVNDPQGATGVAVTTTNDNPALINGISVAGTYPNFTLAITTKTGITGTAVVTVKVSDGTNFTTKSFKVVVTPTPYTLSVETLAGRTASGGATGYTDGTGAAATFTNPRGATADNRGLIYVQDGNLIRSINTGGVVTTLAGGTANTTRVDGVGAAAGIPALGTSTYAAMKVSPDNNWLYFMNNGWLRKMGINPSDSANYKNVTSVMAFTGSPAGGGLVFSSDGTKIFQVFDYASTTGKIKQFDLNTNTISNLNPDGNAANNVCAAWMVQGPNNTAFLRYHPGAGTTAYFGGLFSVNLATGAFTRLANNGVNADTFNGSPAYNPITNEILVDTNGSNPKILDASTGALKYTLPATGTTGQYTDGVGSSFEATDAITVFGGVYYLSQGGPATTTAANIRSVKPAPGLYNPGTQVFTEGQANYFDNTALEKMGVSGNGSTSIAYTLTAIYGTLNVSTVSGLTGVSGRGTKSLSFTGSEADINAALATLAYTPDTGFINATAAGVQITGTPLETLTATVIGTNGSGLTLGTNSVSTSVLVKALNNTPRILTPLVDKTYLVEQAVSTETAITFNIADADTPVANFTSNGTNGARITATSDNPNLILSADMLTSIGGGSAGARTLAIKHQPNITGVA